MNNATVRSISASLKKLLGSGRDYTPPPKAVLDPASQEQADLTTGQRILRLLRHWRLPALALLYILVYLGIDFFIENAIRYYIFCIVLVVSSLYFSWYLGGKETMLYVTFFNIFFAFIFSRLIYISGGVQITRQLFLGRSFLVLYAASIIFMTIMTFRKSPADLEREEREVNITEEKKRSHRLELMVAQQKLTQDTIKQANMVKDDLLLLQGAWRSQIHSIINDLPPVKERELYDQIVAPFQDSIVNHLKGLESRLSFNPRPMKLGSLHDDLAGHLAKDRVSSQGRMKVTVTDHGWAGSTRYIAADPHKLWEILLNLIRNCQSACELRQIALLREDRQAYLSYRPALSVDFLLDGSGAGIRVTDNGGGMDDERLAKVFREPVPSAKRGGRGFGQGTIFVKFFGESMGMEITAENTHALGDRGLAVTVRAHILTNDELAVLSGADNDENA